jgi:hypothetical protein
MKKADFIKATANGQMPVFITSRGVKCIAVSDTDTAATTYIRVMAKKTNAVIVRAIKFVEDEQGKITAEIIGSPFTQQINQINQFAVDYSEAYAQIAAMATRASNARRARIQAETEWKAQCERNEALIAELLPALKELLATTGVDVRHDLGRGSVQINVTGDKLESLIELLAHSVSE